MALSDESVHNVAMRFIYVLEDEQKFQKQIVDAVNQIDPKIQVRFFLNLESFAEWVKELMLKGPQVITQGGRPPSWLPPVEIKPGEIHYLVTVIAKVEFLNAKQIPLIKKTRELFVQRQVCPREDPTTFVLTTFEDSAVKIKEYMDASLNNLIFKPFDRLILTQHLIFAIEGRRPPSTFIIANQRINANVEMLKEVKLEAVSDVGFITYSDRKIDKSAASKYYANFFSVEKQKSIMATLQNCQPAPNKEGYFTCAFSYYAASPAQISSIRKKIRSQKSDFNFSWETVCADKRRESREIGVVFIDEDTATAEELAETLRRRFEKIRISTYKSFNEFMTDLDPKMAENRIKEENRNAVAVPKAFPLNMDVKIIFDHTGATILDVIHPSKQPIPMLGTRDAEIKVNTKWWLTALGTEQFTAWKSWVNAPKDIVLIVKHENFTFYIRPRGLEKDDAKKKMSIRFEELTTEARHAFLSANSKIPKITDVIVASHRVVFPSAGEEWFKIKEILRKRSGISDHTALVLLIASKDFKEEELRQYANFVSDIFYKPMDRTYFIYKLYTFFPELKSPKEPVTIQTNKNDDTLFTANPVQISEISEAGIMMQYYRTISVGSFRDFVLWQPYDVGAPRLVATCNYCMESASQEGIYNIHFVFFGMTDHFLKTIRIWIRDTYIQGKER
jgi:hypothetical protein